MKRVILIFIFILAIFPSFAQEKNLVKIAEGKYFTVYGHPSLDTLSLLDKIKFDYQLNFDDNSNNDNFLAGSFDSLFLKISDILDMHVYSFHGNIKILPTKNDISAVFKSYFGKSFPERSFFLKRNNTIYISYSDLTLGMLGHEIAHAIMSRYFVVDTPVKVQEILAGYVEYQLKKMQ